MKVYNDNSLVNVSNSILKHFHVPPFHETLPELDEAIKDSKKVAVILFDGMGQNIIKKHLKENSFIRKHYLTTVNSTFPPTTAAATTALLTGKYPIETGWISWTQYFKEYNCNVILFRSKNFNTGESLIKEGETPIAERLFPKTSIIELIARYNKDVKVFSVLRQPAQKDGPVKLKEALKQIYSKLRSADQCLLYFYWDSPDGEMHQYGINSLRVHHQVKKANRFMEKLVKNNKDTTFILLADHGHINIKLLDICDHEDIYSLVDKPLSMEKRAVSFFIKKGKEATFCELFSKYYGNHFELISKEEALKIELFGKGEPAKGALETIGEYIAISKDEYSLWASKEFNKPHYYKGHHGGGTSEERLVDISVYK